MHEVVHASIVVYLNNHQYDINDIQSYTYSEMILEWLNGNNYNEAQHNQFIRDSIVDKIKASLEDYGEAKGYALSEQFYENLAWAGLQETDAYDELEQTRKDEIETMLEAEITNNINGATDPQGNSACN